MRYTHHATVARSDVTHVANATVPQIQISAIFRTVLSSDAIRLSNGAATLPQQLSFASRCCAAAGEAITRCKMKM
jgi:hypothetical protein